MDITALKDGAICMQTLLAKWLKMRFHYHQDLVHTPHQKYGKRQILIVLCHTILYVL